MLCNLQLLFAFYFSFKNCTELWELFFSAFAYKNACNVTYDDYVPYVKAAMEDTPANQVWILYKKIH